MKKFNTKVKKRLPDTTNKNDIRWWLNYLLRLMEQG